MRRLVGMPADDWVPLFQSTDKATKARGKRAAKAAQTRLQTSRGSFELGDRGGRLAVLQLPAPA